ncbi:MAG: hypothetical protein RIS70_417 [Planctomycetota bacterium]|jgi:hypothetical protein
MIDPFPEAWQLLAFFHCEPTLLDPDVPWAYNQITFDHTFGDDRVQCVIEPGYERLDLSWWQHQSPRLTLRLCDVTGLTVVNAPDFDCLVATFRDPQLMPLRFQLRPCIRVEWGTSMER